MSRQQGLPLAEPPKPGGVLVALSYPGGGKAVYRVERRDLPRAVIEVSGALVAMRRADNRRPRWHNPATGKPVNGNRYARVKGPEPVEGMPKGL